MELTKPNELELSQGCPDNYRFASCMIINQMDARSAVVRVEGSIVRIIATEIALEFPKVVEFEREFDSDEDARDFIRSAPDALHVHQLLGWDFLRTEIT